jgi:U3 small nucleolar RNA-associated protein 12
VLGLEANPFMQLLTALANNSLEVFSLPKPGPSKISQEPTKVHSLNLQGHRTDVRTLAVSSDDQLLASASNGTLKVWNVKTTKCLRTLECGYAITSAFLPGDRHVRFLEGSISCSHFTWTEVTF